MNEHALAHSANGQAALGTAAPGPPATGRRWWIWFVLALVGAGLAIGAWKLLHPAKKAEAPRPVDVQVTQAELRSVPVVVDAVGKVLAHASVEVRPQTGGVIRRVLIQDGQQVRAGQPLFVLDASTLEANLAQARSQWAHDQALADDAAAAAARMKPLAEREFVTAREYESAVSTHTSLQAAADATKATIAQARIALGYATVTAPISGKAGAILVKPGALVTADNATPLVVVNSLAPVDIQFAVPQSVIDAVRAAASADRSGLGLRVDARDSLSHALRATGVLAFVDNAFDDSSGTIALKATFANADQALTPGAFYGVRITLRTDRAVTTVPERAVQQGQDGPFVYVVTQGRAHARRIGVDRVVEGIAVVTQGLRPGEALLASVPSTLRDGSPVRIPSAGVAASSASGASS